MEVKKCKVCGVPTNSDRDYCKTHLEALIDYGDYILNKGNIWLAEESENAVTQTSGELALITAIATNLITPQEKDKFLDFWSSFTKVLNAHQFKILNKCVKMDSLIERICWSEKHQQEVRNHLSNSSDNYEPMWSFEHK